MSGSIQYPDFARTFAAAENTQLNRLRLLAARREDEQGRALDTALAEPGVAEGLANNDVNVLRRLVTLGRGGRELALPRLDQARQDAEFTQTLQRFGLGGGAPAAPAAPVQRAPSGNFAPIINKVAAETGVPPMLLAAVMNRESGGNPAAAGDATLPGGPSIGLMQIRPDTARSPGFGMAGVDPATLTDPEANIRFGAQYMKALYEANGRDWNKALQAYNGGQGNVQRGTVSPAAAEYAQTVQANAGGAPAGRSMDITPEALAGLAASRDPRGARLAQVLAPFVRQGEQTQVVETSDGVMVVNKATGQIIARIGGAPQRGTTVNVGGDRTYDNERAKSLAERASNWEAAETRSAQTLARVSRAERLLEGFETGALANTRLTMGQLAVQLGLPDTWLSSVGLDRNAIASAEALRGVSGEMLLGLIGPGGFPAQNFSNADREMLERSILTIANTPGGNRLVLAAMRDAARVENAIGAAWRRFAETNGDSVDSVRKFQNEVLPGLRERYGDPYARVLEAAASAPAPAPRPGPQMEPPAEQQAPTATGPGGRRLILRNGQWVPM